MAHDIDGGIAQRFGVQSTGRVRSLTLIDVVSFDSYPSERTRQQMADGLDELARTPDAEHRAHFRDWLLSTHSDPASFDSAAIPGSELHLIENCGHFAPEERPAEVAAALRAFLDAHRG